MDVQCEVKERPVTPVLSIRTRCPVAELKQNIGLAYEKIEAYLGKLGRQPTYAPFVAYYNMDMNDLDVEIGFPTEAGLPGAGEIQASALPAGKALTAMYTGSYEKMAEAYAAIETWSQERDLKRVGIVYEFYHNDPSVTAPEQLITEIVFPLVE